MGESTGEARPLLQCPIFGALGPVATCNCWEVSPTGQPRTRHRSGSRKEAEEGARAVSCLHHTQFSNGATSLITFMMTDISYLLIQLEDGTRMEEGENLHWMIDEGF